MNQSSRDIPVSDQLAVAFAFLAYLGESSKGLTQYDLAVDVMDDINANIPKVPQLTKNGAADWEIVWGPAFQFDLHDQKNMMCVVRQISEPNNYIVAVRGTNFRSLPNWIDDDLDVFTTVEWDGPEGQDPSKYGSISRATHSDLNALISMVPLSPLFGSSKLPGAGTTLATFLANCVESKINLGFCGHSLAGATSPTLALYFAQAQGPDGWWDPAHNAKIRVTAFAGPTPGDGAFAKYMNRTLPKSSYARYYDQNDVVPKAWQAKTFAEVPSLYSTSKVEPLSKLEMDAYGLFYKKIEHMDYQQAGDAIGFPFPIETGTPPFQKEPVGHKFSAQVAYQHHYSYATHLDVLSVLEILAPKKGG